MPSHKIEKKRRKKYSSEYSTINEWDVFYLKGENRRDDIKSVEGVYRSG